MRRTIDFQVAPLKEFEVLELAAAAKRHLNNEKSIIYVTSPIMVCGDIHSQVYDLLEIFNNFGWPKDRPYLFLGDYVDRGIHGIETICLLFDFMLKFPSTFHLLRGNHESRHITQMYGFYDECLHKYGSSRVWSAITEVFDYLPLCAVIDNRILCMHGGLSPSLLSLDDISGLRKGMDVPQQGPVTDLLWADPDESIRGWGPSGRNTSFTWGKDVTTKFCHDNNLDFIIRAHQLLESEITVRDEITGQERKKLAVGGFSTNHDNQVMTVFSAPNYMYKCGNKGATVMIQDARALVTPQGRENLKGTFHNWASPSGDYVCGVHQYDTIWKPPLQDAKLMLDILYPRSDTKSREIGETSPALQYYRMIKTRARGNLLE